MAPIERTFVLVYRKEQATPDAPEAAAIYQGSLQTAKSAVTLIGVSKSDHTLDIGVSFGE
ncbi:hypothetical protein HGO21_29325 [Acinetobacter sp. CUI P1]|nr:hypothetical protein [Acinetobacter sp. CUI P1]